MNSDSLNDITAKMLVDAGWLPTFERNPCWVHPDRLGVYTTEQVKKIYKEKSDA